ncbi:MAG: hypothetical protein DBP03_01105 [gamma proteobacterium symbiont of Ctena orbiculata]|nr:MAG: hypothetical protein DBP03_01105 [gamma proteobacterium symbiont of Ctena orbiculata]
MLAPAKESSKMLMEIYIAKSYIIIYLLNSSRLLAQNPASVILAQNQSSCSPTIHAFFKLPWVEGLHGLKGMMGYG